MTVPASYAGFEGLPAKAADAVTIPGADPAGDIALDVDVTLPDPGLHPPPAGGYPLLVFMHGCCSGTKTSWQAETVDEPSSSREVALQRRVLRLEGLRRAHLHLARIRAWQEPGRPERQRLHRRDADRPPRLRDQRLPAPRRSARGRTVQHRRDARWRSTRGGSSRPAARTAAASPGSRSPIRTGRAPGARRCACAAAAPRYGWTDLAYSLVPNGPHLEDGALPAFDGSTTASPDRLPEAHDRGRRCSPPASWVRPSRPRSRTAIACLQSPLPIESNPQCAGVREHAPAELRHRPLGLLPERVLRPAGLRRDPARSRVQRRRHDRPALPGRRAPPHGAPARGGGSRLPRAGVLRRLPALRPEQAQGVGRPLRRAGRCLRVRRLPGRRTRRRAGRPLAPRRDARG